MLIDAATQMKSENMMLSKISQAQRQKRGYQKLGGGGNGELLFHGCEFLFGMIKFWRRLVVMVT